jgi:hypothetical protein
MMINNVILPTIIMAKVEIIRMMTMIGRKRSAMMRRMPTTMTKRMNKMVTVLMLTTTMITTTKPTLKLMMMITKLTPKIKLAS